MTSSEKRCKWFSLISASKKKGLTLFLVYSRVERNLVLKYFVTSTTYLPTFPKYQDIWGRVDVTLYLFIRPIRRNVSLSYFWEPNLQPSYRLYKYTVKRCDRCPQILSQTISNLINMLNFPLNNNMYSFKNILYYYPCFV